MLRRAPLLACLAALSAACGVHGQDPMAEHLDRLFDRDLDLDGVARTAEALAKFGPRAGQRLVERWLEAVRAQHALEQRERNWFVLGYGLQVRVKQVLLRLGPGAEPAVARLLDEAKKPAWAILATLPVIVEVGPWHPALLARLDALQPLTVEQLRAIMPAGTPPDSLVDWQLEVEQELFRLSSRLSVDPHADVPDLIDALGHENPWQVELAAQALGTRGAEANTAVPALVDVVRHRPHARWRFRGGASIHLNALRRAAADALWQLAPEDPRSVPALVFRFRDSQYPLAIRCQAARVLGRMGPQAADAVPDMVEYRKGWDDDGLMREVCAALGSIGEPARSALPMLDELARVVEWDDALATAAADAAARIREESRD